jgi:uncharacterized protein YgiM (DUF1202 family)
MPTNETSGHVTKDYERSNPAPLIGKAGETVTLLGETDPWENNPAWVWLKCRDARGNIAWTPANYLTIAGDTATLTRDYSALEMTAQAGDAVTILEEESGWYWCRTATGEEGWLPISHVARDD